MWYLTVTPGSVSADTELAAQTEIWGIYGSHLFPVEVCPFFELARCHVLFNNHGFLPLALHGLFFCL